MKAACGTNRTLPEMVARSKNPASDETGFPVHRGDLAAACRGWHHYGAMAIAKDATFWTE
jgi:hypothetical protein